MAGEIDPARFIAGLKWLAEDLRKRGAREIWHRRGDNWISAGWRQDDGGPGESRELVDLIAGLAAQMEAVGIDDVTLIQTNEIETGENGRVKFTGKRTIFARWKWNRILKRS